MKPHTTTLRVRYAETDASGIVYYNNYFIYFEVGRVEMFRELGLPYDQHLPIVEAHCRFHASACFEDLLEVQTFVEEVRSRAFRIGSRVFRVPPGCGKPELLVEGYVAMATVDDQGQLVELPQAFREAFADVVSA